MVIPPQQPPLMPPMAGAPMLPPDPAMMAMGPPPAGPPMGGPPGMPMGSPMGMPPMPPPMDPMYPGSPMLQDMELMLAMQDPEVAQALVRLLLEELDPDPGPKYPAWYDKNDYPKPDLADISTKADQDRQDYSLLIERMRRDRDRIRMAVVGAFRDFDPDVEVTFHDASLAIDVQLIVSILAAADLIIHKTARKAGDREKAQKIENLCYAMLEQAAEFHHQVHGTDFKADMVKTALQTGHLATRVLPIYYAEEGQIPIQIEFLDPATCFPTRDAYGFDTVTRHYLQQVREVSRGFRLTKKQQRDILDTQVKSERGSYRQVSASDTVEVIEFWNRRWYALVVNNRLVVPPTEHHYGCVPFVISRSAIGDPGNVYEQNLRTSYGVIENSYQHDLVNKGQSHIQLLQKTHEQREAIMGIVATELKKIRNPPRTFEQAITVHGDAPAISNAEGSISMLRMGEEVEIQRPPDARFNLMGPILASVNEAAQMGRMSPADYGLAPGSQSSGAVVEGLSESSKDKLNLWKVMIQNHTAAVLSLGLKLYRDHGRKLGPDGQRGTPISIERQHPTAGEDGYFEFDYRDLRDDSCKLHVQMTSLRMQNLGALGNAVQMWDSMGRMTDEEALTLRGVRDPEAYMRKVEIEKFRKTPEFQTARLIEWMKQEGMWDELPTVLYLLSTQGGGGGPQQGPPSAPGALPGNGGAPPTVGMPGAAGQMGGRPPQLPGPTPDLSGLPPGAV
jgi:hypothetical protein